MMKIFKNVDFTLFFTFFLKILVPIVTETRVGGPRLVIEIRVGGPSLVIETELGSNACEEEYLPIYWEFTNINWHERVPF